MTATVFDFGEQLAWSHSDAHEIMWRQIYYGFFPDLVTIRTVTDMHDQRWGIDRLIDLPGNRVVRVEEKADNWPARNFFLELDTGHGKEGWAARALACDYLAYAFVAEHVCYMLPYYALRAAYVLHADQWRRTYAPKGAANKTYTTTGIAVPIAVVLQAIMRASIVEWQDEDSSDWPVDE